MSYLPAARGSFPVGVRSAELRDEDRGGRVLWTEIWYPAADRYAGQDVARASWDRYEILAGMPGLAAAFQQAVRDAVPRPGAFPLVIFSHGFGSHRRQSTFLSSHLASHGYVVAAPDHLGNTVRDVGQLVTGALAQGRAPQLYQALPGIVAARPADVSFVIDELLTAPPPGIAGVASAEAVGVAGHSFGGWTALVAAGQDRRIGAALALAPAGGRSTIPGAALGRLVEQSCTRAVPSLVVAAERDALLPLDGVRELVGLLRQPKRLLVLERADHMHFVDYPKATHELLRKMMHHPMAVAMGIPALLLSSPLAPFAELCPAEPVLAAVRALGLAHFDACLRGSAEAATWLQAAPAAGLPSNGCAVREG